MSDVQFHMLPARLPYTGRELRPGWVMEHTGLSGDAAVAFLGPCHVATEDLVDLDDARNGAIIVAAEMLHIIVEHPDCNLRIGVLRQRILICILCEILHQQGIAVVRDGDDVFFHDRKLTVSIAAPSEDRCLIHLGINIDPDGAPVPAIGLDELGVDCIRLVDAVMSAYKDELKTAAHAETKVREV